MTHWYSVTAEAERAEIVIYDRIGESLFAEGVTAKALVAELSALDVPHIDVRLNSPGGSVWDGLGIYNALRHHPATVHTHIDGLAASAASLIAIAGDVVHMASNALFMIHEPYVAADGGAADMRAAADMLDRITTALADAYADKTGAPVDFVRAAMAAETWYSADEAQAAGFVDVVTGRLAAAASFDLTPFNYRNPISPLQKGPTVETTTLPPVAESTAPQAATVADVQALERQIAALADVNPAPARSPLAAFASLADYATAVYKGDAPSNLIVDQITTDNPGVLPPNWASDIHNIVGFGRPAISALGVQPAGASGMDFAWPYFDGDLAAIVAEQTVQKSEVNSVKVSFKKGTASLKTWGAASDVAYQLIMRSAPSYIEGMLRVYAQAMALATDNAFADALVTGGTASATDYDLAADTDGSKFRAAMFAASLEVETATGSPATVALVASDVFAKAGGWDKLVPQPYGTQNVAGVATASTLRVEVSGLPVIHDRNLAAGSIIVTNPSAASWIEDGPHFANAEVPTKLGRDYAIFSFGTPAIYNAKGVVKVTNLP